MSTAAVLLLVIGPVAEIPTAAMTTATTDVLGARARVTVDRVAVDPPDDESAARAAAIGATAVIEISWSGPDGTRAHLHAHLRRESTWVDRDMSFDRSAPAAERGRAVGLTIAAMIPDEEPAPTPTPTPTPAEPSPSPTPPPTPPTPPPEPTPSAPPTPPPPARTSPGRRGAATDAPARRLRPSALDVGALGEIGPPLSGEGALGGGRLEATWWLSEAVGLRATGGYRASSHPDADVKLRSIEGGLGASLRALPVAEGAWLLVRADLLFGQLRIVRSRGDRDEQTQAGVSSSLAMFADLDVALFGGLRAVIGLGAEIALGGASVVINRVPVATLAPVRFAGQLGLRWGF